MLIDKIINANSKIIHSEKLTSTNSLLESIDITSVPDYPIFLPYQISWLNDKNPIAVCEKSRQIGWSYIHAFRAVYKAVNDSRDTVVTSYNKPSVRQFIKDCTFWAKLFNVIFKITTDKDILKDRNINIFEIRFSNNRTITALPGDAVNLRGYSGRDIVIDEAAYRSQPLDDILAAGMAAIIHGGTIRIGSTHCGTDSDFNNLIKDVRIGKKPFSIHRTTFKEAIAEGLYKRLCVRNKTPWSLEDEAIWIKSIYDNYGIRAQEELDGIPSDFSGEGKLFNKIQIGEINHERYWEKIYFRYHDLASTDASDDKNNTAFYSASIKVAVDAVTKKIIICDYYAVQLDAKNGDEMILETAIQDGNDVTQILELEPGSTGRKWHEYMVEKLMQKNIYNVVGYQPQLQKLRRLIPVANAVQKGMVQRLDNNYMLDLEKILRKCSDKKKPLVSDLGDCLSGVFDYIINELDWFY